MDVIREYVEKLKAVFKEQSAAITGVQTKDYNQMILDLDRPSPKDQTTIFRMRSTFAFSTMMGGVLSTATAWYLTRNIGSTAFRLRVPIIVTAAWGGTLVGSRQGVQMGKAMLSSLEDPQLREIMLAYQDNRLSSKEEYSLKRNIIDNLNPEEIRKQELADQDISIRDQLDHLRHERERMRASSSSESTPAAPTPVSEPLAPPKTRGPTPYLHQRLPEAIEAEKRRNETPEGSSKSSSNS